MEKEKEDYSIYPIKVDNQKLNEIEKFPFDLPHCVASLGRVRAGKTLLCNNLYLSNRFYKDSFDIKILISSTAHNDAQNQFLLDEFDYIFEEYSEELLRHILEDMIAQDTEPNRYLICLDDIIGNVKQKKSGNVDTLSALITKYRHVSNASGQEGVLSLYLTCQYFKYLSTLLRNNLSGLCLMGDFSKKELFKISESYNYFGGSDQAFQDIFNKSRKEKYDFLFLDCKRLKAYRSFKECIYDHDQENKN
jgi:uncharacterized protein YozE (UPF0346 family)